MAAIPRPTGLEHLIGDGLTLQSQIPSTRILGPNDALSSNIEDRRGDKPLTMFDSILNEYMMEGPGPLWTIPSVDAWRDRRPDYQQEPESNPLLDQLMQAARSGSLERDADIFMAAKARSPYRQRK